VEKGKAALRAEDGLPGLRPGDVLPGRWYEESLEPTSPGARVVARFGSGSPAAVAAAFGRGKALMLGSFVSAGYVSEPAESTRRFFEGLLDWAGVVRPVAVTGGDPIEVRLLESGGDHLAFLFNHGKAAAEAAVALRLPLAGRRVVDLVTGQPVVVTETPGGFEWRGRIPPRDVVVLRLGPGPRGARVEPGR
jgi:beta-galactosidase